MILHLHILDGPELPDSLNLLRSFTGLVARSLAYTNQACHLRRETCPAAAIIPRCYLKATTKSHENNIQQSAVYTLNPFSNHAQLPYSHEIELHEYPSPFTNFDSIFSIFKLHKLLNMNGIVNQYLLPCFKRVIVQGRYSSRLFKLTISFTWTSIGLDFTIIRVRVDFKEIHNWDNLECKSDNYKQY